MFQLLGYHSAVPIIEKMADNYTRPPRKLLQNIDLNDQTPIHHFRNYQKTALQYHLYDQIIQRFIKT